MKSEKLVYPYGETRASGLMKSRPQDFVVVEELGFEPSGQGEHLFLQVEKTGLTTPQLVECIARDYALHPRHVGYSGLKDKNALTTQWISLHLPGLEHDRPAGKADGYRILRAVRNRSKLRRGTHKSNFFSINLTAVESLPDESRAQLQQLGDEGMANYFGAQRFGRAGDNVEQALSQLDSRRLKRTRRSLLLSSLRSYLFNRVLSRRIGLGYWREPLDGDVFMLRGSRSIFSEALNPELRQRYAALDISSTASLYGSGASRLEGEAARIEQQVFDENREITDCLERQDLKRQMRALRVIPEALEYDYSAAQKTLHLQLRLPAGAYLTSLLGHFIKAEEPAQADF